MSFLLRYEFAAVRRFNQLITFLTFYTPTSCTQSIGDMKMNTF